MNNKFTVATKNREGKFEEKEFEISDTQQKLVKTAEVVFMDIFNDPTVDPQVVRYNLEGLVEFIEDILGRNGIEFQKKRLAN